MKFEEILPLLKEGKEIKRKNRNKINYIRLGDEDFIVDENDECFPFILEDFLADNWEIVNDTNLETTELNAPMDKCLKEPDWKEMCIKLQHENYKLNRIIAGLQYALWKCVPESDKE